MRKVYNIIIFMLFIGCVKEKQELPPPLTGKRIYVINSLSETVSIILLDSEEIVDHVFETGNTPNYMLIRPPYGYIVNSGFTNPPSLQVFTLNENKIIHDFPLPVGSNPWSAEVFNGVIYVTGFATDKVYILGEETGEVLNEVLVGKAPQDLLLTENHYLLVVCSGYDINTYEFGEGYVYVLHINPSAPANLQILDSIPVGINPEMVKIDNEGKFHVLSAGDGENGGKIYVFQPEGFSLIDSLYIGGFPIFLEIKDGIGYVSYFSGKLISYDTEALTILKILDVPYGSMGIVVDSERVYLSVFSNENMNYVNVYNTSLDSLLHVYETGESTGSQFLSLYSP